MAMYQFVSATSTSLTEIGCLLDAAELPRADLTEAHLAHFIVCRAEAGGIVGVIGVEPVGDAGLLRSLAVSTSDRGAGLGQKLVQRAEQHAKKLGLQMLYLLTTTARDYFLRLGYEETARDAVPAAILATREFAALCPQHAVCLSKRLGLIRLGE